jgi:peptide/nickel transport system substrate-binding protein
MQRWSRFAASLILGAVIASGCAPAQGPAGSAAGGTEATPAARKRVTIAALGDVFTVNTLLTGTGLNQPGISETAKLLNVGLTLDNGGVREARLAEAVPTTENGLWKVLPDGKMEMTWKIRPGARWHDGTPVTAEDFVFTSKVASDRELGITIVPIYAFLEGVQAPDPQTVVSRWKSPYINADELFGNDIALPRHLLEPAATNEKASFAQLAFWTTDYVGNGPFRLQAYEPSSHLIMVANDDYVLGRPKIDEIEVKFIPSPTTSVANILAGAVELTFGRGLSIDQAISFRDQWNVGHVEILYGSPTILNPKHQNPTPALIADVRFRRALLHALDRQSMADGLQGGLVKVADSGIPPDDSLLAPLQAGVTRYPYDPRKALQMIEELGYTPIAGGGFRNAAGERLAPIQVWSSSTDLYIRTATTSAALWKTFGLDAESFTVPDARDSDLEFRASFPAFEALSQASDIKSVNYLKSSEVRSAANGFRGRNRGGYVNDELDTLIDRYYTTIPLSERMHALDGLVRHLTSNVVMMWLFENGHAMAIHNRLVNVTAAKNSANAHEWDVRTS